MKWFCKFDIMKILLLFIFIMISLASRACPFCNSKTAKEIRASLLGTDLSFNLFITILPFIIFSAIVYLIYHGGFPSKRLNNTFNLKKGL